MELTEAIFLAVIFLMGGVIKGMLGIGLPALLIGLLTFSYAPRYAMALILLVLMTTNFRQAMVGGSIWQIIKRHKYFCAFASVGIFWVAYFGAHVPARPLQVCVGVAMVIFAVSSLFGSIPVMRPQYNTAVQSVAGIAGGILGGLTAIWGPPLAMYLMSLRLSKDVLIQTMGVMFAVQSVFLTAGIVASGELTWAIAGLGAAALIPTFIGMYFGEKIRAKMDTQQFMRVFVIAFIFLGLNLIRRGVLGS